MCLVFGITTFVPIEFAVAFEGKDVCTNTVEEPAIVGDYYCTASEVLQTFFQRAESVNIDIVGWLIKQEYVGLGFERQCQV